MPHGPRSPTLIGNTLCFAVATEACIRPKEVQLTDSTMSTFSFMEMMSSCNGKMIINHKSGQGACIQRFEFWTSALPSPKARPMTDLTTTCAFESYAFLGTSHWYDSLRVRTLIMETYPASMHHHARKPLL